MAGSRVRSRGGAGDVSEPGRRGDPGGRLLDGAGAVREPAGQGRRARRPRRARPACDGQPRALRNCTPGAAAYHATILDLAARGFLTVSNDHGGLLVTLAQAPPGAPGLTDCERQVLGDVRARLADTGAAPFGALAEACAVDVPGTWDPFEKKLIAEARDRGICRPLLPLTARTVLLVFAATAAIAAVTVLVAWPHRLGALDGPVWTPLIAALAATVATRLATQASRSP